MSGLLAILGLRYGDAMDRGGGWLWLQWAVLGGLSPSVYCEVTGGRMVDIRLLAFALHFRAPLSFGNHGQDMRILWQSHNQTIERHTSGRWVPLLPLQVSEVLGFSVMSRRDSTTKQHKTDSSHSAFRDSIVFTASPASLRSYP